MTFKEFMTWCNERTCDGYWGILTALTCIDLIKKVKKIPFYKREKLWKQNYEQKVLDEIVNPINEIIRVVGCLKH